MREDGGCRVLDSNASVNEFDWRVKGEGAFAWRLLAGDALLFHVTTTNDEATSQSPDGIDR